MCFLAFPPTCEELRDAEAQLASLNETPGDCPGPPAPASLDVKEEVGEVDASEFLVTQGIREIEAADPESQGWQLWSPSVLASCGSKVTIDLDTDSDADLPDADVVPLLNHLGICLGTSCCIALRFSCVIGPCFLPVALHPFKLVVKTLNHCAQPDMAKTMVRHDDGDDDGDDDDVDDDDYNDGNGDSDDYDDVDGGE